MGPITQKLSDAFLARVNAVKEGAATAASWLQQAAEQHHAEAARSLATLYRTGRGVGAANANQATRYYRIAARGGLDSAQYALAWRLFRGEGATRSLRESTQDKA